MARVYVDMDDVLCDLQAARKASFAAFPDMKYPQSQYGFFRNLQPIAGATDGFKWLSENAETYILTAPSVRNPLCYSEKREWVERWLGLEACERLIISPHKHLLIGDYLIDDNTTGRGQDKFTGHLIHFGSALFKNWEAVIDYFKAILNENRERN